MALAPSGPGAQGAAEGFSPGGAEVLRRSELLEICVQTLAALQLCLAPGGRALAPGLPAASCAAMSRLLPMVGHMLRPRRLEDADAQRYHLGPQRLEAFVRRPDEDIALEVARLQSK